MNKVMLWTATLLLAAAPALRAERPGGEKRDKGEWKRKMEEKKAEFRKELGLTPEQEKKLEAHRKAHREKAKPIHQALREKREAVRAALAAEPLDEAKVRALHGEIKALSAQLDDHRLEGVLSARKILSAEQFKKFHELGKKHWGRKMGGRKGGPRGPGGPGKADAPDDDEDGPPAP